MLAFSARTEGSTALWVRRLDSMEARALPGSEGAYYPFWSPDSRWIGFFSESKLKKIEASGGPAQTICDIQWHWPRRGLEPGRRHRILRLFHRPSHPPGGGDRRRAGRRDTA